MKNLFTFIAGGVVVLAGVLVGTGLKPVADKSAK